MHYKATRYTSRLLCLVSSRGRVRVALPCTSMHMAAVSVRVQVDVFSLGVIMYELFTTLPLADKVTKSGGDDDGEFEGYARLVAAGHREEMPASWPQQLKVCPQHTPRSAALPTREPMLRHRRMSLPLPARSRCT